MIARYLPVLVVLGFCPCVWASEPECGPDRPIDLVATNSFANVDPVTGECSGVIEFQGCVWCTGCEEGNVKLSASLASGCGDVQDAAFTLTQEANGNIMIFGKNSVDDIACRQSTVEVRVDTTGCCGDSAAQATATIVNEFQSCWRNSEPVVSSVMANQRAVAGGLVNIYYTLADVDDDACFVALAISSNGGSTWTVPPTSATGDIGSGITPWSGRHIVWDPTVDAPGQAGCNFKVLITADDGRGGIAVGESPQFCIVYNRPSGSTERVSVSSVGEQGNRASRWPSVSASGRYVAFSSHASNLVPGDTNGESDIFLHDRVNGETTRVSVASDGTQGNDWSGDSSLSADGRYVEFVSEASNLVRGDTNGQGDVFVHDRVNGETTRVSVASDGTQGNNWSGGSTISADGRHVAFLSLASNLVPGDTNETSDVFVHDRVTRETTRVSVASDGAQGNKWIGGISSISFVSCISADGRYVAFDSLASNLVPGDTNGSGWYGSDVFVHDCVTRQTTRVSVASDGTQGNSDSYFPSISADGRYVAFDSYAANLVPGDTNATYDAFVHDRVTRRTSRVSVASNGTQGNSYSGATSISVDGRYVTFGSNASNLVPRDTNATYDAFVHDRVTCQTTRVSVASDGTQGNSDSAYSGVVSISSEGRFVAFESYANNLVSNDTNGHLDVFVRSLDAAPLRPVTVWTGTSYSAVTHELRIAATAFDSTTGTYVYSGTGTFEIAKLGISGAITSNGVNWSANVDLSSNPPSPGSYTVAVTIAGGSGSGVFQVLGTGGNIHGIVRDAYGEPVTGATVCLYENPVFFSTNVWAMGATTTDASGVYRFQQVPLGWVIITGEAPGFVLEYAIVQIRDGANVEQDLTLGAINSLAPLRGSMAHLYFAVREAMDAETERFSEITGQAAEDFDGQLDAFDFLSWMDGVLSNTSGVMHAASKHVGQHAQWMALNNGMTTLAGAEFLEAAVFVGIDVAIEATVRSILPEPLDDLRLHTPDELKALPVYADAFNTLRVLSSQFDDSAGSVSTHPEFDYDRARQVIDAQKMQLQRITDGQLVMVLAPPDPGLLFDSVQLPITNQAWLLNHALLGVVGAAQKVSTTIAVLAGGYAAAAAISGVGLPAAPFLGAIALKAALADDVLFVAEIPIRGFGAIVYVHDIVAWAHDMVTLTIRFLGAKTIIEREAKNPVFLRRGSTFSAAVIMDGPLVVLPTVFSLPLAIGVVSVTVTNTSDTAARTRLVATGWWKPGDFSIFGEAFPNVNSVQIPVSVGAQWQDLAPAETATFALFYAGFHIDPISAFSPHWLQVDVYSGPFLVYSQSRPYWVFSGLSASEVQGTVSGSYRMTVRGNVPPQTIETSQFGEMLPAATMLFDGIVSADAPLPPIPFTVPSDAWSVEFVLQAGPNAAVSLRVYDEAQRCVGFDASAGGVQHQFVAEYSGAGLPNQTVMVPAAGGQSFTIVAVLDGMTSPSPVMVSLWAMITPLRPAILSVVPGGFFTRAGWSESVSILLNVAEGGGQVPVQNVTATLGNVEGLNGVVLPVVSLNEMQIESLAAGHSQKVSFMLDIPTGTPRGRYTGSVTVISVNAGAQSIPVVVEVLLPGDFDADGDVDLADHRLSFGCFRGPGTEQLPGCGALRLDGDFDVDLRDWQYVQQVFGTQAAP